MELPTPEHVRHLNTCCTCKTLDSERLEAKLSQDFAGDDLPRLVDSHPYLFAHETVFLSRHEYSQISRLIPAVERIRAQQDYLEVALAGVGGIASRNPLTKGAFNSYDFHLTRNGPRLIEINTNAGGGLLAAVNADSHRQCCSGSFSQTDAARLETFEQRIIKMFHTEWMLAGRKGRLKTVAIVDEDPKHQYLYPEFLLMRSMFARFGIKAVITDPASLSVANGGLFCGEIPIDLVYNRLTDFELAGSSVSALRHATETGAAVVTPHPWHHATLANKRNMITLTDEKVWAASGLATEAVELMSLIPKAVDVAPENADFFWKNRKQFYFKPLASHAGKGVYRGAKITKSAWADVVGGGYIAQEAVSPSERIVAVGGEERLLKADLRAYTYGDEILLVAARLYQGQTTNMRTPGGGFAPVVII